MGELNRVFRRKSIWAALMCLFLVNALLFLDANRVQFPTYSISVIRKQHQVCERFAEALEDYAGLTADEALAKCLEFTDPGDEIAEQVNGLLYAQFAHMVEYPANILEVAERAEQMKTGSVFTSGSRYSMRNIEKTGEDFSAMQDVELTPGYNAALELNFFYHQSEYLVFAFLLVLILIFLEERRKGLWNLIYATSGGRLRLGMTRALLLFFTGFLLTLLLWAENLLMTLALYGSLGDLSRAAQSIPGLSGLMMHLSVGGALLLMILGKSLVMALAGLMVWTFVAYPKRELAGVGAFTIFVGLEYVANHYIEKLSSWAFLRYINLFAWMDTANLMTEYKNLNLFGYAVGSLAVFYLLLPILTGIFFASSVCVGKIRPDRERGLVRLPGINRRKHWLGSSQRNTRPTGIDNSGERKTGYLENSQGNSRQTEIDNSGERKTGYLENSRRNSRQLEMDISGERKTGHSGNFQKNDRQLEIDLSVECKTSLQGKFQRSVICLLCGHYRKITAIARRVWRGVRNFVDSHFHESWKLFVLQGSILVLALAAYISVNSINIRTIRYDYAMQMYLRYVETLAGDYMPEKLAFLESESELLAQKIQEEYESYGESETWQELVSVQTQLDGLLSLSEKFDALQQNRGITARYLNNIGYNRLYGAESRKTEQKNSLLITVFLSLALGASFAFEQQYGMKAYLASTAYGRGRVRLRKYALAAVISVLLSGVIYGCEAYGVYENYGMDGFDAPVQSVEAFVDVPFAVSVRAFLILFYGARTVAVCAVACLILFLSDHAKNMLTGYLTALIVLALPAGMAYLGADVLWYVSVLNPLGLAENMQKFGADSVCCMAGWAALMVLAAVCVGRMEIAELDGRRKFKRSRTACPMKSPSEWTG
ncbi:MAG: hypothetical protein LUE29_04825 [Lachnospiraceae bacterium]|nr:hypothetical protein [Lachnospiraceae bacterium]